MALLVDGELPKSPGDAAQLHIRCVLVGLSGAVQNPKIPVKKITYCLLAQTSENLKTREGAPVGSDHIRDRLVVAQQPLRFSLAYARKQHEEPSNIFGYIQSYQKSHCIRGCKLNSHGSTSTLQRPIYCCDSRALAALGVQSPCSICSELNENRMNGREQYGIK